MGRLRPSTTEPAGQYPDAVYGIAVSVAACLRGNTRVDVAWNLDPDATPRFDAAQAVAMTPGGGKLGSLLNGAVDSRVIELASAKPTTGRVLEVLLDAIEAQAIGVEPGTRLRILVTPADTLPDELWDCLVERRSVGLVVELEGDTVTGTRLVIEEAGDASVVFGPDTVTTRWSPRPVLVVMGAGPMVSEVAAAGEIVGWNVETSPGPEVAIGLAANLSPIDGIIVTGHDTEGTGRVLQAALGSRVGYIGSIGPQSIQAARLDWLAYRGITGTDRISAPAGIDIGARTPGEVAISVVAEMIATRRHASA